MADNTNIIRTYALTEPKFGDPEFLMKWRVYLIRFAFN